MLRIRSVLFACLICLPLLTLAHNEQQPSEMPFFLSALSYDCDVPFDQKECNQLLKLEPGTFVTNKQIEAAYRRLSEKKRFTVIVFEHLPEAQGTHLHLHLEAAWLIGHITIKGILFGRQRYRNLYLQQEGQVFDEQLHQESLTHVTAELIDQGYLAHHLKSKLVRHATTKLITVQLKIHKGPCFGIDTFSIRFTDPALRTKRWRDLDLVSLADQLHAEYGLPMEGQRYLKTTLQKQSKKIKDHLKSLGFINPRIHFTRTVNNDTQKVAVLFNVTLGRRRVIKMQDNQIFSDQEIYAMLFGQDRPHWFSDPDLLGEQLSYEYYKKGFWHAKATITPALNDHYCIRIAEHERALIQEIQIIDQATDTPLRTIPFKPAIPADQDKIQLLLGNIRESYKAQGFWDFTILQEQCIKMGAQQYQLRVTVDKGIQRLWAGMQIDGYPPLANDPFFKTYRLPRRASHVAFNPQWLTQQRHHISNALYQQHYWYPTVTVNLEPVEHQATKGSQVLRAHWVVEPGKQTHFGHTVVQGTSRIPYTRIASQIKCKEGDLWDKHQLELTRKRLKSLGIFQSVQVWPGNLAKQSNKKPVIVQLIDDKPLEVRARAGYYLTNHNFQFRRQETPKLGGSLLFKNPTNHADKITAQADWTRFERRLAAQYQYPGPFGWSVISQLDAYSDHYICPVRIRGGDAAYEGTQHGISVTLGDDFKEQISWSMTLGNEWLTTNRVRGNLNLAPHLINRTLPYFFIEPELTANFLDDRVNTTCGTNTHVGIKLMLPQDRGITTAKLIVDQACFMPLPWNIVLALHGRFGHILRRTFDNVLPMERFFLGGPNSVRGYEIDSLPPYGQTTLTQADGTTKTLYTVQGGSTMANANIELRFPLLWGLGGVLFQDIGILSQTGLAGLGKHWYPATGFGLRYQTPVGAVRFDVAWKLKKRLANETAWGWHLSLGQAF